MSVAFGLGELTGSNSVVGAGTGSFFLKLVPIVHCPKPFGLFCFGFLTQGPNLLQEPSCTFCIVIVDTALLPLPFWQLSVCRQRSCLNSTSWTFVLLHFTSRESALLGVTGYSGAEQASEGRQTASPFPTSSLHCALSSNLEPNFPHFPSFSKFWLFSVSFLFTRCCSVHS